MMTDKTPSLPPWPRRLSARALLTGALIGTPLAVCNIYAGLKVGWGFNMSVAAVLCAYALWRGLGPLHGGQLSIYETNIAQTAASAAASISSAGLVTAVPALTILTGRVLSPAQLILWLLSVSLVGLVVGVGLRKQMIVRQGLPFPHGVAAAELLHQLYEPAADGATAHARVRALAGAASLAAVFKAIADLAPLPRVSPPGSFRLKIGGRERRLSLAALGVGIKPGLLMVGAGVIVGPRVGISMLIGSLGSWLVIAPALLAAGWVHWPSRASGLYHEVIKGWLIWPGVTLMVSASLSSFLLSSGAVFGRRRDASSQTTAASAPALTTTGPGGRATLIASALGACTLSTIAQIMLFEIHWWIAALSTLMALLLAVVAARISGETGITPKGPMGKVAQLTFGVLAPGLPAANLMTANVAAGAAAQCGDMLHDFKTGALVGASPWRQAVAQLVGIVCGAVVGGLVYPALLPDPARSIGTDDWPAPAVQLWKAVAELLAGGHALPPGATTAAIVAALLGVLLATAHHFGSPRLQRLLPAPTAIGLAMVLPFYVSLAMFVGGALAWLVARRAPQQTELAIVAGSGLIAGESLVGAALGMGRVLRGR